MWIKSSNWIPKGYGFFGGLMIYNVANGIGSVHQKVGNKWVSLKPLLHLRNQWICQKPSNYVSAPNGGAGQHIPIRVTDISGKVYGEYNVAFTCGSTHCSKDTDAPATKL